MNNTMNNTRARIKIFFSTLHEYLFVIKFNPFLSFIWSFEIARDTQFYSILHGKGHIVSGREFSSDEIAMMEDSLSKWIELQVDADE